MTCWVILLLLLLLPCTEAMASQLRRDVMTWQGQERSYFYYMPDRLIGQKGIPLVVVLHGAGPSDGNEIAKSWGFAEAVEKEGMIAVFPNGVDAQWNDGRGKSFRRAHNSHIDDVGFLRAVIDHFIHIYGADAGRVYMTGASNGGMMTLRMGCAASDKLTAIAPMLASMPEKIYPNCYPEKPLPVMMINSTADPIIPFAGGSVTLFDKKYGKVTSVRKTLEVWLNRNGCESVPITDPMEEYLPEEDVKGITEEIYSNCLGGKDVMLFLLEGGGHSIPSLHRRETPYNHTRSYFQAADEIIQFFKQYRK